MLDLKKYRSIFDALPMASVVLKPTDPDYQILEVNSTFLDVTQTSKEQVLNQYFFRDFLATILENNQEIESSLRDTLAQIQQSSAPIESKVFRCQLKTKSQLSKRYWQFTHNSITDGEKNNHLILQTLHDVTNDLTAKDKQQDDTRAISSRGQLHIQDKVLEDQIAKKINQYEAASKELNDFIYSVSHDLRAPLRRIDGFSQELINEYIDQLDDMGAHYLQRVRQGAQDMGNLIDDLLKLSRISRRKVELEPVDLSEIAQSVYDDFIEFKADRNITFNIQEELWAKADQGLTKVILTNLISNALKFTGNQEQTIIEMGSIQKNGSSYFYIKDNGVGFDPDYSEKLFKAFDRLHSQKEFEGNGIGLATVKRIVNLHGGSIWAESTPGEGAIFYFNFKGKH